MKRAQTPRFFTKFFQWYCKTQMQESIMGDLEEQFEDDVTSYGLSKAKRRFAWNVIRFFRPAIIKSSTGIQKLNYYGMFRNYFKITWRSLIRQKLYSFINISGLVIGITIFLLISIYVHNERSYDMHYENSENIYNIYQRQKSNFSEKSDLYAVTPAALAPVLMAEYPEVGEATTLTIYNTLLEVNNEFYLEDVLFADEHYLSIFKHKFIIGNSSTALSGENGAVITKSLAIKLFGDQNALGEKITFWSGKEAFVTGVIEDLPSNSTLNFSCILSLQASQYYQKERAKTAWNGNDYYTFFTLNEKSSISDFEEKIQAILKKHWVHTNIPSTYLVAGLGDLHLRNNVNSDIGIKGSASRLRTFSIVAIMVLVLACVNYMNLAIARSVSRAKEVGLRKAIGAAKRQLVFQFLSESVFLSLLSFSIALVVLKVITPFFGTLVERDLSILLINELNLIPMIVGLVMLIGLISGSYPALFMSSLKPIEVLKGKVDTKSSGFGLQKVLIVAQYVISIVMISFSLVIYFQMRFIDQKELGFQKEQILTYEMKSNETRSKVEVLREAFSSNPLIQEVTFSSHLPTYIGSSTFLNNDRTGGNIYRLYTDEDFINVFELELLAGRFLSSERDSEGKRNFVLNESAAKALGWTAESAVGKEFINENGEAKTVIGVVKDFHMHSMYIPVAPLMIGIREYKRYISVKLKPENLSQTVEFMEEVIGQYSPYPFDFQFIDDHFDQLYKKDKIEAQIFGFFTLLALLIASLGLFGLAAYSVNQRTKEIGIRKVLGASISNIVITFSKRFLYLVVVAFILAIPISWYFSNTWLDNFAYRIDVSWWIFLLAGVGALVLAFTTISSQSIKASLINPVESLKDE